MRSEECELDLLFFWKTYFKKNGRVHLNKLGGRLNQLNKDVFRHFKIKHKNLQTFFEAYPSVFCKDAYDFVCLKPPPTKDELQKFSQCKGSVVFKNDLGGVVLLDETRLRVLFDIDSLSRTQELASLSNFEPILEQKVIAFLPPNFSNKFFPNYTLLVLPQKDGSCSPVSLESSETNISSPPLNKDATLPSSHLPSLNPAPHSPCSDDSNYISSDKFALITNVHGKVTNINNRAGLGYVLGQHNGKPIKAYFDDKSFRHSQYPGQADHKNPISLFKPSDEVTFNGIQLEKFWYVTHLSCDHIFSFMKRFTNLSGILIPLSMKFGVCQVQLYGSSYFVLIVSDALYHNEKQVTNLKPFQGSSIHFNAIEYKQVLRCTLGWINSCPFEDKALICEEEWRALLKIYKSFELMDEIKKALEILRENPSLYFPGPNRSIKDSSEDTPGSAKLGSPSMKQETGISLNCSLNQSNDSATTTLSKYYPWNGKEVESRNIDNSYRNKALNDENYNNNDLIKNNKISLEISDESSSSISDISFKEFLSSESLVEELNLEPPKSKILNPSSLVKNKVVSELRNGPYNLLGQNDLHAKDQKKISRESDKMINVFEPKASSSFDNLSESSSSSEPSKNITCPLQTSSYNISFQNSSQNNDFDSKELLLTSPSSEPKKTNLIDNKIKQEACIDSKSTFPSKKSSTSKNPPDQFLSMREANLNHCSNINLDSPESNFKMQNELFFSSPSTAKKDPVVKPIKNEKSCSESHSLNAFHCPRAASQSAPSQTLAPLKSLLIICKDQKGQVSKVSKFFAKITSLRNSKFTFTMLSSQFYRNEVRASRGLDLLETPLREGDTVNFSAIIAFDLLGKQHTRLLYTWVGQKPTFDNENISAYIHDLDIGAPFQKVFADIPSDSELSNGFFLPDQPNDSNEKNGVSSNLSDHHEHSEIKKTLSPDEAFIIVWEHLKQSCFKESSSLEEEIQIKLGDLKLALYQGIAKILLK